MEACSNFKYLAVDTEGYIPNPLGISVSTPLLESMYFPIGHAEDVNIDEETHEYLREVLIKAPYRVLHNAGHDLVVLPYLFDLPFIDTMIMGHMVDENVISKGLDWMHKTYCPKSEYSGKEMPELMASIIKTLGWYMVPYALMYVYATTDALITMELFLELKPKFEEQYGPIWSSSVSLVP